MLQELPPALGLCSALVELTLGFNALRTLPDELGMCTRLATLDARNNALTALGDGVPTLQLSLLDLTNNDLRALPPALGGMTSLRAMPLTGNPLTSIPRGVREGPLPALLRRCSVVHALTLKTRCNIFEACSICGSITSQAMAGCACKCLLHRWRNLINYV